MAPAPMWPGEVSLLLEDEPPSAAYSAAEIEAEYVGARDSLLLVLAPEEVQEMSRLVRDAAAGAPARSAASVPSWGPTRNPS